MCQYHNLLKLNKADKPTEGWKIFRVQEKLGYTLLLSLFHDDNSWWLPGNVRCTSVLPSSPKESSPEEVTAGFFHAFYRKEDAEKYIESIYRINKMPNLVIKKVKIPVECAYYKGITYTLSHGDALVEGLDSFASQYLEVVE